MKPLRKNVAIAIDGGGLRGVITTRAMAVVERAGIPWEGGKAHKWGDVARLIAGTSTGSVISAALGVGLSAAEVHQLYCVMAAKIFKKSISSTLWPIFPYRYPNGPLIQVLKAYLKDKRMADLWQPERQMDIVMPVRDLVQSKTHFIKSWKSAYQKWPVWKAVVASCSVPTFFPVVEGSYVDGGVGSYANPCYVAAYEARQCLKWKARETTLISLGTGRGPSGLKPHEADTFLPIQWLSPLITTFMEDANEQQVRVVNELFYGLDFRRFQVDIPNIPIDDPAYVGELTRIGDELGRKILGDEVDTQAIQPPQRPPKFR
jgi:predicted acylesterase/phospholipase RssA